MGTEYRRNFIEYDWSRMSNARLSTPPAKDPSEASRKSSARRKQKQAYQSTDSIGNKLHARLKTDGIATLCPPWSTPYCSFVREQPTTLKPMMTRVSDGLVHAQEHLETRRYQPTYADHGLDFRMSREPRREKGSHKGKTIPSPSGTTVMQPAKEALKVEYKPLKHPLWWGQAALPAEADRPTYEDLGSYYPKAQGKEMQRAESLPVFAQYRHDNPFVGTGSAYRRAPGGGFVCDVSVAEKP
mmetsp:Transcript_34987/g.80560  ORF Transcript_34987/g.80560 Transcript_34987/m.80560 type:complete len:242 (+) Transcript_34987:50-775(+)